MLDVILAKSGVVKEGEFLSFSFFSTSAVSEDFDFFINKTTTLATNYEPP
tara:strand:+ start:279 stop:428 length:150 start_codon:yes stop_codon:yes gene_type:complete